MIEVAEFGNQFTMWELPCSFTCFFEKFLQSSSFLTKFVYKLCIWCF